MLRREDGFRHLILVCHPSPRGGNFLDAVPVRSGAGKGGQAAQVRESGSELGGIELWLLGHRLIPVLREGSVGSREDGKCGPTWGTVEARRRDPGKGATPGGAPV